MYEKLKSFWNWLKFTGLWLPIPLVLLSIILFPYFLPDYEWDIAAFFLIFLLSHIVPLLIWNKNSVAKRNGKTEFPLIPMNTAIDPEYQYSYRTQALNKRVNSELLVSKPEGIIFGKSGKGYVSVSPGKKGASHTLVLGPSGSGKTSSVLGDSILASTLTKASDITWIVVDVKGELEEKFFHPDQKFAVFNPRDRSRYGFDCLYDLNDDSNEYDVLTTLRKIVYSLIPANKSKSSETFWIDGPRNILQGLWLYGWEKLKLRTLPDLVDFSLSANLKTLINDVLSKVIGICFFDFLFCFWKSDFE